VSSYYAAQDRSTEPGCIALPETAQDVSTVITSLTDTGGCTFAIRSGGHSSATGGSNIADGVTIDLRGLDTLEVSSDRSTVSIGIGNTWGDVYSHLDPLGLAVPGGRAATVGVGGLSLGGGISFFSTRYGWTTDNIINFEVVLADGSIVNANTDDDPDLLWALRGGTNNFGVVTRIDMAAFEQGPFWGGYAYFPGDTWPQQVKELVAINSADDYDEYAHITMTWGFAPGLGTVVSNQLQYTQEGVENPAIFDGILALPSLVNVLRTTTHSTFTADIAQQSPGGSR
jgi:FAD/FMN-containing dehydrogenase